MTLRDVVVNRHVTRNPDISCRCGCYGCRHHCGAHWPPWYLRAWAAGRSERAEKKETDRG